MGTNKEKDQYPVWFNTDHIARYEKLSVSTPFREKVKQLLNEYIEQKELTLRYKSVSKKWRFVVGRVWRRSVVLRGFLRFCLRCFCLVSP